MQRLEEALRRVLRFVGGKDDEAVLRTVRFLPAEGAFPARVLAMGAELGCMAPVEGDLPDVLVHAEPLKAIAKQTVLRAQQGGHHLLLETSGGAYTLPLIPTNTYPSWPVLPDQLRALEEWPTMAKVLHAAGKVPGRPDLGCVHFYEDRVEATDAQRMALADVHSHLSGMVPLGLFTTWPKKSRAWAEFTVTHAFFKFDKELRFGWLHQGKRVDCQRHIPEYHEGPSVVVPTKSLRDAVKQAADSTDLKWVRLRPGMGRVLVASTDGEFQAPVESWLNRWSGSQAPNPPTLTVSGKFLLAALKAVDTPNVRLCYTDGGDPSSPIRLESGGFVECIWPIQEVKREFAA